MKTRLIVSATLTCWGQGYWFDHNGCEGGPYMHPENITLPTTLNRPVREALDERCEEASAMHAKIIR